MRTAARYASPLSWLALTPFGLYNMRVCEVARQGNSGERSEPHTCRTLSEMLKPAKLKIRRNENYA